MALDRLDNPPLISVRDDAHRDTTMSLENHLVDQGGETEQPCEEGYDEIFADLMHRTTIPDEGPHSMQALHSQFEGTPISSLLDDIQEGQILPVEDLLHRVILYLISARKQISVFEGRARRRAVAMMYCPPTLIRPAVFNRWWEDEENSPQILATADQVRATIFDLVPDMQLADPNDLSIELTPVVKHPQQLLLHEERERRLKAPENQAGHVLSVLHQQFSVFERGSNGLWKQRGSVLILNVSEHEKDPDILKEEKLEEEYGPDHDAKIHFGVIEVDAIEVPTLRSTTVLLDTPLPHTWFNQEADEDNAYPGAYYSEVQREVYAALPPHLDFPWPESPFDDEPLD